MTAPLPEHLIVSRRESGLLAPRAPRTRIDPDELLGVVVHWFGIPAGSRRHLDCPGLWRSVQRGHMGTHANPGEYVDIAYNMGVCPHAVIFRGRGTHYRAGANGTTGANRNYGAVVYMAGEDGPRPDEPVLTAIHRVIRQYRYLGAGRRVLTHGSITGSECPGPHLRLAVKTGRFSG